MGGLLSDAAWCRRCSGRISSTFSLDCCLTTAAFAASLPRAFLSSFAAIITLAAPYKMAGQAGIALVVASCCGAGSQAIQPATDFSVSSRPESRPRVWIPSPFSSSRGLTRFHLTETGSLPGESALFDSRGNLDCPGVVTALASVGVPALVPSRPRADDFLRALVGPRSASSGTTLSG